MSEKDLSAPAFQSESSQYGPVLGMSIRDYFAAKALSGFCSDPAMAGTSAEEVVSEAYYLADLMILERAK